VVRLFFGGKWGVTVGLFEHNQNGFDVHAQTVKIWRCLCKDFVMASEVFIRHDRFWASGGANAGGDASNTSRFALLYTAYNSYELCPLPL